MFLFTPRNIQNNYWVIFGPLISVIFTIIVGALIFKILSYPVTDSLYQVFLSPFSRADRIADIFVKACPLIIIGIGLIFCFRSNIWNIGAEGQFIFGTLCAGSFALFFPESNSYFLLLLMLIIGFLGGALWASIPAILKIKLNVNEILVSLMLVYVAMLFIDFIVRGPLRDPMSFGFPLSKPYPEGAIISKINFPGIGFLGQLHYGILSIVFLAPFAWFLINRTLPGFQIKVFGSAPKASGFAGFNKDKITLGVLVMSGGMAGVAGVIEVSANMGQLQPEVSFGYGFTAIIVAFLGRLNPYGVIIAGIVIATAKLGADNAQMVLGIPKVVTGIFEGVLLFFLLAGETIQNYKVSFKRKN